MVTCPNCKKLIQEITIREPIKGYRYSDGPQCRSEPTKGYRYSDGPQCRSDLSTGLPVSSFNKKGPFAPKMCLKCKEMLSQEHFHTKVSYNNSGRAIYRLRYLCKECERVNHRARSNAWLDRKREEFQNLWYTWNEILSKMPQRAIKEEDWIAACRYFKGCSMCNERHVETREFFQKPIHNGKYSALNILPMCGKCATVFRHKDNPFEYFTPFKAFGIKLSADRLKRLMEYIASQLEGLIDD